ncbi:MAG: fumarylacetoacetate hydrolase family protein [Thermoplasmata archaeon]
MSWVETPDGRIRVGKILGLVRNYRAHAREGGTEPPPEPVYFLKPATALLHEEGRVVTPLGAGVLEAEAELAFVMGATTKSVPASEAEGSILGYCAFLDITARELQRVAMAEGLPWTLAKGMDGFAPISKLRPREDVGDPHDLEICLEVNGELRQRGSTAEMVHRIPGIVAAISTRITLERGDVIATGTPANVPRVRPGDRLDLRVSGVGRLRVTVEGSDAP